MNRDNMKVLFIIDSLKFGGTERRLVELLKGLGNITDIQTELVVMGRQVDYPEVFKTKTTVHFVERKCKKDLLMFAKLYQLFKRIGPDIIHNWGSMAPVYAAPCAWLLGIPFLNGIIVDSPPKHKIFHRNRLRARLTFPFSDCIIANSCAGLKSYRVKSSNGICIHNGFDFNRLNHLQDKDVMRKKLNLNGEKVVVMVAAFEQRKDYRTFLNAATMIMENNNNVVFLAIGGGKQLDYFKNSIPSTYAHNIRFLGKQNDVESIINIADIGVLTTNPKFHGEGISNSIMEYMALGKPVIATRGGGTAEIVRDKETGFLIKPENVNELTDKIDYLLHNQAISSQFGINARHRIETEFNLDKMVFAFVDLYRKMHAASMTKKH